MAALTRFILYTDVDDDISYRHRIIHQRKELFEIYDERNFKIRFRLDKSSVISILEEIEPMIEYSSNRNSSVSPINQLLLTLRYYATGSFSLMLADYGGVSKATANRIIHRVSKALSTLRNKYILFPETADDIRKMQVLNFGVASFPKVVGFMDCTHIKIFSPGGNDAELFRNRKSFFSLNCQIICNANLEVMDLVARWPGSSRDTTIFNACFRNAMFLDGRYGDALLLGDSGYPLRPYLMTPVANPVTRAETLYNESHIRSRNCIERLFGIWKRRFPVLALEMLLHLKNIFPVITACAVLQNILRARGDNDPPDDPSLELPAPWEDLLQDGQITPLPLSSFTNVRPGQRVRNRIIGDYFHRL